MPLADAPQSNKQHAVPQNIMDVEFKLIGDLTMRQFSYLLLCGILAYVSAVTLVGIFKWPLVVIFSLLGIALAFVPLGERGLDDWIVSFIRAINMPTQRYWKKEPEIPIAFSYQSIDVMKQELITLAPTLSRRKLEQYLKNQVEGEEVDPLDIPEQEYIMKVRDAFSHAHEGPGEAPSYRGVSTPIGVSVIEEPELEVTAPEPAKEGEQPQEQKKIAPEPKEGLPAQEQKSPVTEEKKEIPGTVVTEVNPMNGQALQGQDIVKSKIITAPAFTGNLAKGPMHLLQEENLAARKDYQIGIPSITPDMHSGRKFMNLLPSSGELILPIRGERVLRTSDQAVGVENLMEKTEKLKQLLARIREKEGIRQSTLTPKPVVNNPVISSTPAPPTPEPVAKTEQPEKSPEQEQTTPIVEKTYLEDRQNLVDEQKKQMVEHTEKMASGYSELGKKYQQLQTELKERKQSEVVSGATTIPYSPPETKYLLTQKPDILSGVIKGADGKLLSDILIIVKNKKGEAVRAVKTNSMGQFILLTPLDKGIYTVEISSSNNLTETFGIIPIEVKGEVIPLLEFNGK